MLMTVTKNFFSLRHNILQSWIFYLGRKGKVSKFWSYISSLPKSHPTLLTEWPTKYVKQLPAVFRRNYSKRVRDMEQQYDKINTFYDYYTNQANPNQLSMSGCTLNYVLIVKEGYTLESNINVLLRFIT